MYWAILKWLTFIVLYISRWWDGDGVYGFFQSLCMIVKWNSSLSIRVHRYCAATSVILIHSCIYGWSGCLSYWSDGWSGCLSYWSDGWSGFWAIETWSQWSEVHRTWVGLQLHCCGVVWEMGKRSFRCILSTGLQTSSAGPNEWCYLNLRRRA